MPGRIWYTTAAPRRAARPHANMAAMPAAPPVTTGRVFRPRSSIAAAILWAAVTLVWAWFAVRDGGAPGLARQAPGVVLAATLVYAVLVRPTVEVSAAGVTLRNVVRDVEVPWAALAEVRTRYALTLVTTGGRRFTGWAAPASGRHTDARLTRREVSAIGWDPDRELPTASASTASHSGAVAAWVRREWRRAAEAGDPDGAAGSGCDRAVRTSFARGVVAAFGLATALTVVMALA